MSIKEVPHRSATGGKRIVLEDEPEREAILFEPSEVHPIALVVELHGSGLDPLRQYEMSRLADRLVGQGIAVLLPQAGTHFQLFPEISPGFAWNIPGMPLPGGSKPIGDGFDDAGYVTRLVLAVQQALGLSHAPVFLCGYSGGARFASHILAAGDIRWSAAGLVSGLRAPNGGGLRPPPPTISFHGVIDCINPFMGGAGPRWDMGVVEAGQHYAAAQHCGPTPETCETSDANVSVYRTPDGEIGLSMFAVGAGTHAWPGSRDVQHLATFGAGPAAPDASTLIAQFFRSQLPPGGSGAAITDSQGSIHA